MAGKDTHTMYKVILTYTSGRYKGQIITHDNVAANQILDTLNSFTQYQLNHADILVMWGSIAMHYHDFLHEYYTTRYIAPLS